MSNRIEQIIGEIEDYIGSCKTQKFSSANIIVNKDEIDELLTELRTSTPEEIKRYQKIISNKEAILADANAKAEMIIAEATSQNQELVSEHQIMQAAYAQANEVIIAATKQAQQILDDATNDANAIKEAAMGYLDDMLGSLEGIMKHTMEVSEKRQQDFMKSIGDCYQVVISNRAELHPEEPKQEEMPVEKPDDFVTPDFEVKLP